MVETSVMISCLASVVLYCSRELDFNIMSNSGEDSVDRIITVQDNPSAVTTVLGAERVQNTRSRVLARLERYYATCFARRSVCEP